MKPWNKDPYQAIRMTHGSCHDCGWNDDCSIGVGLEGLVFLRYISLVLHSFHVFLVGPGPHFPLNQPMIGCRVRTFTFKCQLLIYWVVELCFGCEIWTPYYIKYIHQISAVIKRHCFCFLLTLPKTDIAFEHKPSQKGNLFCLEPQCFSYSAFAVSFTEGNSKKNYPPEDEYRTWKWWSLEFLFPGFFFAQVRCGCFQK